MSEEQKTEEPTTMITTSDMVEKALAAAERLEKANKTMEEHVKRLEAAKVENLLSGETTTNNKKVLTQEQKDTIAARSLIRGSGYEDELFPGVPDV